MIPTVFVVLFVCISFLLICYASSKFQYFIMSEDSEQYFLGDRPLADLKVVELRKELEIRSLPKSGNKKELVERLQNFLRDEKAEQTGGEQLQQAQKTSPTTEPNQSPSAAAVSNVVAHYLAQQQIQLQAARRSADKIRAGTSVEDSAAAGPISSPTNAEVQHAIAEQKEDAICESAEVSKNSDQTSEVQAVKSFDEERTKAEEKGGSVAGSAAENEPEINEKGEQEEEKREVDEREEQTKDEEEERQSRVEEDTKQDQQAEESVGVQESAITVQGKLEPEGDEHEQLIETLNGDVKLDAHAEEISPVKSAKARSALAEEELDFENEEEDEEEREEPADDGGKRRSYLQQGAPITMKSFEQQHTLAPKNVAEEVTGGISTGETIAISESEIGPLVGQLTASIQEESSKPPEEQQETTPEGFVRRRPSSPARHPPSRWIHLRNLKRPFTKTALFDLLGKFGTVDTSHFWMDSIKSTCIATYETEEQAQLARERLHNVVWPAASDLALCVEFSTEEKLKRRKAEEEREASANNSAIGGGLGLTIVLDNRGRVPEPMSASGPTVLIQHDKKRQKEVETRKRKVEELEKSQKTLDELFKKTKTLPAIYFLPLSEEEATKRRKHLSDAKQQSHSQQHNTSESHRNLGGNSSRHRQNASGGNSRRIGSGGESGGRSHPLRR